MTQFQLFSVILFLLFFVRPTFYKRDWKDIDWEENAVAKFLCFVILLMLYFAFTWYISGVLLPYVNYYMPAGVQL